MPADTLRVLLAGLIDYAGLFPPAALEMPAALANYAAYRKGEHAWMLGRFVVPAARAGEVDRTWPISKLQTTPRRMEIAGDATYYEIPVEEDPAHFAPDGVRAKIRLGGETVPTAEAVAGFLRAAARAKVPFKATAGLHHPIRSADQHGFVNLFLAAAVAWYGEDPLPTLEERSAAAFHFGDDSVGWHAHSVAATELREVREQFAISFGSCSFEEPIQDLKELGWL
jgi:hypothetical protein